jgi:hypothetical protein
MPDLPRTIQQGNTLRIRGSGSAVAARMNDRTIRLFPEGDGSLGLMPVPVDQKPGAYKVDLLSKEGAPIASLSIRVVEAHFTKQNVVIEQSLAELKPSPRETETVSVFRNEISEVRYWSEPLALPVRGCVTSLFGVQRYMNGKPTGNFHGGLDQRSPAGTPVRAVDGGIVKIVRDWALHGRTVGIDHGQGLESMYLHMSKLAVAEGDVVKKGDVVGYVGSTGRSTAPHLHWSLYVNGVPVNPRDWVQAAPCQLRGRCRRRGHPAGNVELRRLRRDQPGVHSSCPRVNRRRHPDRPHHAGHRQDQVEAPEVVATMVPVLTDRCALSPGRSVVASVVRGHNPGAETTRGSGPERRRGFCSYRGRSWWSRITAGGRRARRCRLRV